ncbi:MAG: hypothetical protein ACRDJY_07365 [Thermoleophilaceae bacterium]
MLLTVLALTLVALALAMPTIGREVRVRRQRRAKRTKDRELGLFADPGRERRAEQRARELLRSCVNDEEWAMYRDLGFIRVRGATEGYAYLIYPQKPVVAYLPETGRLLNEYCVEFPDISGAITGSRLPASDDVLAKWMALTGDERRLIRTANMHLPGRQVDPGRVRRDLWRLAQWERERSSARS